MKSYKAILFDLFDTLVDLHFERFPVVQVDGETRHSTSGRVYEVFQTFYSGVSFETFYRAFVDSYRELEALKKQTHREITSQERFSRMLESLGFDAPPAAVIEQLIAVHMGQMFEVTECPDPRRAVLEALHADYPLALVSNFDHPPTAYRVLDHYRLTGFFRKIVISGEVGWRKPGPEIFRAALDALKVPPEAALHVGDTPLADILGAAQLGLSVAWLDRTGQPLRDGIPAPTYTIRGLPELLPILKHEPSEPKF